MFPISYLTELGLSIEVDEFSGISEPLQDRIPVFQNKNVAEEDNIYFESAHSLKEEIYPSYCFLDYSRPLPKSDNLLTQGAPEISGRGIGNHKNNLKVTQNNSSDHPDVNVAENRIEASLEKTMESKLRKLLTCRPTVIQNSSSINKFFKQTPLDDETLKMPKNIHVCNKSDKFSQDELARNGVRFADVTLKIEPKVDLVSQQSEHLKFALTTRIQSKFSNVVKKSVAHNSIDNGSREPEILSPSNNFVIENAETPTFINNSTRGSDMLFSTMNAIIEKAVTHNIIDSHNRKLKMPSSTINSHIENTIAHNFANSGQREPKILCSTINTVIKKTVAHNNFTENGIKELEILPSTINSVIESTEAHSFINNSRKEPKMRSSANNGEDYFNATKKKMTGFLEVFKEPEIKTLNSSIDSTLMLVHPVKEEMIDRCNLKEELVLSTSNVKSEPVVADHQSDDVLTHEIHIKSECLGADGYSENKEEKLPDEFFNSKHPPPTFEGIHSEIKHLHQVSEDTDASITSFKSPPHIEDDEPLLNVEISGAFLESLKSNVKDPVITMDVLLGNKPRRKRVFNPESVCLKEKNPFISPTTYVSSPNSSKQVVYQDNLHYVQNEGWICDKCGKIFKARPFLKKHKKQIHFQVNEFCCPVCNKLYDNRSTLHEHIKSHQHPFYKCPDCNKVFPRLHMYERHYERYHGLVGSSMFTCIDCSPPRCFYLKSRLCNHVVRVHLRERNPCKFCGKIISDKHMRQHLRVHARKQHLQCIHCKKYFTSLKELKDHWKSHSIKGKKLMCRFCGKFFKVKNLMVKHLHKEHKDKQIFECKKCGKTFFSFMNLDFHSKIHEERRYNCVYCDRNFVHKHQLMSHINSITCLSARS